MLRADTRIRGLAMSYMSSYKREGNWWDHKLEGPRHSPWGQASPEAVLGAISEATVSLPASGSSRRHTRHLSEPVLW